MDKHTSRLPVDKEDSPRWIATQAYVHMLRHYDHLRTRITGAQYGKGPPDEGSIVLLKEDRATVYFNESTGKVFVEL